ncbi:eukaryotic translation initiation factor 4E [Teratosphaeria nubilosa]|uniref:Eukaryotic translation initiation factor 4E n=1 Tax=Teratosphaeria nubilosa TaxID=161662 RepID=A0A6G1L817_9PEZI|nr:eukaryotic translation initiation factor 4E [Teratosphaeria nubilosa]
MAQKDENSPSNLWTRRSNKLSLSMNKTEHHARDSHDSTPSAKRYGSFSSHGNKNPFNAPHGVASPTSAGGSSAFGLGSGAFGFGSATKTPKTPGSAFDFPKSAGDKKDGQSSSGGEEKEDSRKPPVRRSQPALKTPVAPAEAPHREIAPGQWPLKYTWVIHYRPPTNKTADYEASIQALCQFNTVQDFFKVYHHLKRPSSLPTVSDYHLFREGIRPVWEDEQNKRGGKWILKLKKGVADRYWEDLLLAIVGDQFVEASEEITGTVVSVRSGEDQISIWVKMDGGRNVRVRETIKRVLNLPPDTQLQFRSHDESITQGQQADQARKEKLQDKRRNTLQAGKGASASTESEKGEDAA